MRLESVQVPTTSPLTKQVQLAPLTSSVQSPWMTWPSHWPWHEQKPLSCSQKSVPQVCTAPPAHWPKASLSAVQPSVKAFGDKGIHARSAVGVAALPLDAPVEVEVIVSVRD